MTRFSLAGVMALALMTGAGMGETIKANLAAGFGKADDGRVVTVRGVIDACLPDACSICPDWDKAARFDGADGRTGCLSIMRWKDAGAGLMLDELFRFTEIEISARFHFRQPDPADVNVLCLDFRRCQGGFDEAMVLTIFERRAVEKVRNFDPRDAVLPIDAADDRALRQLFWNDPDFSLVYLDGPETDLRTYWRPPLDTGSHGEGWLCFARKSVAVNPDEPFPWPTTYRAVTLRSPANPYRCRLAWKEKGTWRIIRELQKLPVYGLD